MMNWFMYCVESGKRNRGTPSPPPLDVPKATLNTGTSVGERIVKKYDMLAVGRGEGIDQHTQLSAHTLLLIRPINGNLHIT